MMPTLLHSRPTLLSSVIILAFIWDVISDVTVSAQAWERSRWKRSDHFGEKSLNFRSFPPRTGVLSANNFRYNDVPENSERFSERGLANGRNDNHLSNYQDKTLDDLENLNAEVLEDRHLSPAVADYSSRAKRSRITENTNYDRKRNNEANDDGEKSNEIQNDQVDIKREARGSKEIQNSIRDTDGVMSFRIGDQTLHFPSLDVERNVKYRFKFGKKSVGVELNCDPTSSGSENCPRTGLSGDKTQNELNMKNKDKSESESVSNISSNTPTQTTEPTEKGESKTQPHQSLESEFLHDGTDRSKSASTKSDTENHFSTLEPSSKAKEDSGRRVKRLSKLDLLANADDLLSDLAATGKNKAKFKFGKRTGFSDSYSHPLVPQSCENCQEFGVQGASEISSEFIPPSMIFMPGKEGYFPIVVRKSVAAGLPKDFGLFGNPASDGSNRFEAEETRFQPVRSIGRIRQRQRYPDIGNRFKFGKR